MMHFIALITAILISGCSNYSWYTNYDLQESDLQTDKAVDAACRALNNGDKTDKRAAANYLLKTKISPVQASTLSTCIDENHNEFAVNAITQTLIRNKYNQLAYPLLVEGLQHKSGRVRALTAGNLGSLGCDAKDALPMLKVISTNDGRGVQERAKIALREISLDCMMKNIPIE